MMTSCMTGLQPLKNLQQSPDEIKGYQGLLEILEAQLGSTDKAHQILKEVQDVFPENRRHDNAAASNLADSRTHSDGHQFPQP